MEIKVKGNRRSYQQTQKVDYLEISLNGDFGYNANTPINFQYGEETLRFESRHQLLNFSEKAKGASLDRLILILKDYNFNESFIKELFQKGQTEISLLKTIFLIYNWIEIPLSDPINLELKKRIYNDFIIDYSGKPEVQKDIYFIDEKYTFDEKMQPIQKLLDLNLLVSATINTGIENYQTYFIPIIRPGVSKHFFKSEFDLEGIKTYDLWKKILRERDERIRYWMKNHF